MRKIISTEEWIEKVKLNHGDQYIYDEKCIYKGVKEKVTILCKKHGYFTMEAGTFTRGSNCPECALENRKLTEEDFLERAKKVHGDKYKYIYNTDSKKITVICPKHGAFTQYKFSHLRGYGCLKCAEEKRFNINKDNIDEIKQSWMDRFIAVHGDKYDYSKFVFVNAKTSATIICPIHGEFQQAPYYHSKGQGCPKCALDKVSNKFSLKTEGFIKRAREIHGDKYEYVGEYKNMRTKMEVICPTHGKFLILPTNHIYHKEGCPECGKIKCIESNTMTTEQFVNRCKSVHGDKYDYSITNYNGWDNHFQYICHKADKNGNEHGIIEQLPSVHILQKCGCPKCSHIVSRAESEIADFVSKIQERYFRLAKSWTYTYRL